MAVMVLRRFFGQNLIFEFVYTEHMRNDVLYKLQIQGSSTSDVPII